MALYYEEQNVAWPVHTGRLPGEVNIVPALSLLLRNLSLSLSTVPGRWRFYTYTSHSPKARQAQELDSVWSKMTNKVTWSPASNQIAPHTDWGDLRGTKFPSTSSPSALPLLLSGTRSGGYRLHLPTCHLQYLVLCSAALEHFIVCCWNRIEWTWTLLSHSVKTLYCCQWMQGFLWLAKAQIMTLSNHLSTSANPMKLMFIYKNAGLRLNGWEAFRPTWLWFRRRKVAHTLKNTALLPVI